MRDEEYERNYETKDHQPNKSVLTKVSKLIFSSILRSKNVPSSHNDLTIDFFLIPNCKIGINEHNKTIQNNETNKIKTLNDFKGLSQH